jgi:hypothetical protein
MWSPDGRYLAYRASDCSSPDHPLSVVISDAEGNVLAAIPTGTGWKHRVGARLHTRLGVGQLR